MLSSVTLPTNPRVHDVVRTRAVPTRQLTTSASMGLPRCRVGQSATRMMLVCFPNKKQECKSPPTAPQVQRHVNGELRGTSYGTSLLFPELAMSKSMLHRENSNSIGLFDVRGCISNHGRSMKKITSWSFPYAELSNPLFPFEQQNFQSSYNLPRMEPL